MSATPKAIDALRHPDFMIPPRKALQAARTHPAAFANIGEYNTMRDCRLLRWIAALLRRRWAAF